MKDTFQFSEPVRKLHFSTLGLLKLEYYLYFWSLHLKNKAAEKGGLNDEGVTQLTVCLNLC